MNIKTNLKSLLAGAVALAGFAAVGVETTAKINMVKSGEPWTEVTVDYTLAGIRPGLAYKVAFDVTSRGVTRGVTNAVTRLADGPASQTIDVAALFNSPKPDPEAEFAVTVLALKPKSVQLWEGGPYWAECNLGATSPEQTGYFFWWGDTVGCKRNATNDGWVLADGSEKEYVFDKESCPNYYLTDKQMREQGWIDASGVLSQEHDAARVQLGDPWRMPTIDEFHALTNKCTLTWTVNWNSTGIPGCIVQGKGAYADKSIFFPITGQAVRTLHRFYDDGFEPTGANWTSTYDGAHSGPQALYYEFKYVHFYDKFVSKSDYFESWYGWTIRPVQGFAK